MQIHRDPPAGKTLLKLLVLPALIAMTGCISSSNPSPPERTTVVVPSGTTVVCPNGAAPPC